MCSKRNPNHLVRITGQKLCNTKEFLVNGLLSDLIQHYKEKRMDNYSYHSSIGSFPGCDCIGLTKPLLYDLYHPELMPIQQKQEQNESKGLHRDGQVLRCNPRGVLPGKQIQYLQTLGLAGPLETIKNQKTFNGGHNFMRYCSDLMQLQSLQ